MKYHKKNLSKPVLFLTASLMACQPVSALGVTFSDLDKVPWPGAETSIQKAADLGLMVGETQDGKTVFRPRDSVSLCETAQLAYKVMVNTGKLTADSSVTEKWSTTMQTYQIPDWAYTAVAQCLEKNIVSISDLSGFMQNGTTASANRETAVEILGRALEAVVPSMKASGTTSFGDDASISADAKPYIALLAQQKIVSGDTDGKFNPKNTLNRTETAVLVSNLYTLMNNTASTPQVPQTQPEPIAAENLEGKIAGLTNFYVNFEGNNSYFYFASEGTPTVELNKKTVTMAELIEMFTNGTSMDAKLTLDSTNHITGISVTAERSGNDLVGTITGISKNSITIGSKSYSVKDTEDVRVYLDGSLRKYEFLLQNFSDGITMSAEVSLNTDGRVTRVDATTISSNDKKGKITDLSKIDIQLDKADDKIYDFEDADEVPITINGDKKNFEDLLDLYKDGETIEATLTVNANGKVTKIVATTSQKESSNKGVISSLSTSKLELKGGDSFDIKAAKGIEIDIKDGTKEDDIETWDNLVTAVQEKKELTVTVETKNDSVSKISGNVTAVKGEIQKCDTNTIKIITREDNEYTYAFADKVTVDHKEISAKNLDSFLDWMDEYFSASDDINVTLALRDGLVNRIDD